jgi:hypothetical protein
MPYNSFHDSGSDLDTFARRLPRLSVKDGTSSRGAFKYSQWLFLFRFVVLTEPSKDL